MGSIGKSLVGGLKVLTGAALISLTGGLVLLSDDFEHFMSDSIGESLLVFGIEGEDLVSVNVHDQLLFEESEDISSMLTQLAITHAKTDIGIITLLTQSSNNIRGAYNNYFYNGENEYLHGLPETNLQANTIPSAKILAIISAQYGVNPTKVLAKRSVPTKQEVVSSVLFNQYGYTHYTNTLSYNSFVYHITSIDYNYSTDNYDVIIGRKTIQRTVTTVTITSIPDTIPEATEANPEPEPIPAITKLVTTHVLVTLELVDKVEVEEVEEGVEPGEEVDPNNIIILDETVVTEVPIETEIVDSVEEEEEEGEPYEPVTLYVPASEPTLHYIMVYHTGNIDDIRYWTYQIGLGTYTELDNATEVITNLEMLPVISLRNSKVSITEDKESEEYLDAKSILHTIGLDPDLLLESIEESPDIEDVTSAHIHFGVDPRVEDPIIARALYELFDYVYVDSSLYKDDNSSYSVTMIEGAYNASLLWKEFNRTTNTGSIGPINTYENVVGTKDIETDVEIEGPNGQIQIETEINTIDTLLVRRQITTTLYVEYEITYLASTTFIADGKYYNTTSGTLAEGTLIIPISKFFIDKLTPLEQMDLFAKSLRLSIYAVQVTHLKYYQTEKFGKFVKIVMYVIAIVIFVVTWFTGGATSAAFLAAVKALLITFAASYAFKMLLESTDNAILKAIYTAIYVVIMVYSGAFDVGSVGLTTANTIIFAVSSFTQTFTSITQDKMQVLNDDIHGAQIAADEANRKLEEAISTEIDYFSTAQVAELATIEHIPPFIDGVDAMMYKAIELNFKAIDLTVHDFYTNQFDYEKYYHSGVV